MPSFAPAPVVYVLQSPRLNFSMSVPSGNVYVSNSHGLILTNAVNDISDLTAQGCVQLDPRNNFVGTANPVPTNDFTEGFNIGSIWYNTANHLIFVLSSMTSSAGSAVWSNIVTLPTFRGTWDASANSPAIASGVGSDGDWYWVAVAGSTNVDGISSWAIGEIIVFDGAAHVWKKVPFNAPQATDTTIGMLRGDGETYSMNADGTFRLLNPASFESPLVEVSGIGPCLFVVCDGGTNVIFCQTVTGDTYELISGSLQKVRGRLTSTDTLWDLDVATGFKAPHDVNLMLGFLVVGQSWAQGVNEGTDTAFTTTALDPDRSVMSSGGACPPSGIFTNFAPLVEGVGVGKETICSRASHAVQGALDGALGRKMLQFWGVAALGGTPYTGLERGTNPYTFALQLVQSAAAAATAAGYTFRLSHLIVIEGETDFINGTQRDVYLRNLNNWLQNFDDDIRPITNQTEPLRALVYQTALGYGTPPRDPNVSTAELDWSNTYMSRVLCTGPWYAGTSDQAVGGNGIHLTCESYAYMGETLGHALLYNFFGPGWSPLQILTATWRSATVVRLTYSRPVMIDTSGTIVNDSNLDHHGYDVVDGTGTAVTISSTALVAALCTAVTASNQVTLGGAGGPTSSSSFSQVSLSPETFVVTNNGINYAYTPLFSETFGQIAAALAAMIPGGSSSGLVITVSGAVGLASVVYSRFVDVTLAGAPAGTASLLYACRITGDGCGNLTGARGTVRDPTPLGASATSFGIVYDWACVQCFPIPT